MKTWVFVFIAIRLLVSGVEEYIIIPTAWFYVRSLGQTKIFLGLVLSVYNVSAVLFCPAFGVLSDKFRRQKTILIICHFIRLCGNAIYSIPVSGYCPLFGRLLCGISTASESVLYAEVTRNTEKKNRAKAFIFLEGMYILGSSTGPAVASLLTFNVNIFGWKIDAGNSPGFIMTIIWTVIVIFTLFLPRSFKMDDDSSGNKLTMTSDDLDDVVENEESVETFPSITYCKISCLFYLMFITWFLTCVVTFYTPLLARELFHLQLVHVKLLFLNGALFFIAVNVVLYIAAEYFQERSLLLFTISLQIIPIVVLAIFALFWNDPPANLSYLLIIYIDFGLPYSSFTLACSLLSKITSPERASFYQGLSLAVLHGAVIPGRVIPSFIFTMSSVAFFSLGLGFLWALGLIWFCSVYQKLESCDLKHKSVEFE